MPPRRFSRHTFTRQVTRTSDGAVYLTDRQKFKYEPRADTISHKVVEGDTWHNLSARYYSAIADLPDFSAASLWWVIADFQQPPVHDPTVVLASGSVVLIPSMRAVTDRVFNPNARTEDGGF